MKNFNYYHPTEIRFGSGRVSEIGEVAARYGKRALLITVPAFNAVASMFERIKKLLKDAGIEVAHFDGVVPNPTTVSITAGAKMAKEHKAEVVIGLGGGSSMDSAKAIAVEAVHEGTAWDYLYWRDTQPTEKTLPIIAITTTAGTGSQVTQVAVMTHTADKRKSAIFHPLVYPKVAIVDPELAVTLPEHVTASTGFDVFCHAFESYINCNGSNPYTDALALEAIKLVAKYLAIAVKDGKNMEAREAMAWADTLGGLSIANAGVTMPHGIGMTIGGHCPHVMHGEALAVTYPEFTRFTYSSAVEKFAIMGRILNPALEKESDEVAAQKSCDAVDVLLKEICMWLSLEGLKVPENEIAAIAEDQFLLPDYLNNPRVATKDEIYEMLKAAYRRR